MNGFENNKHRLLVYGATLSLAAFIILFGIRYYLPELLDIDIKWIAVAALPVILALIVGKYVKKVSVGGWELELAASERIADNPDIYVAMRPVSFLDKEGIEKLNDLSMMERESTNALQFKAERINYYSPDAITQYVKKFPALAYFIIKDKKDQFVAMVKISPVDYSKENHEFVRQFIDSIESPWFPREISSSKNFITSHVYSNATLVDSYEILKKSKNGTAAVLRSQESQEVIGLIELQTVKNHLAEMLVRTIKAKDKKEN